METGTATLLLRLLQGIELQPGKYEVASGQTIHEAILSIPLQTSHPLAALVNGTTTEMSYILQPGDVVELIPQIAGG